MKLESYEPVQNNVAQPIIAAHKAEATAESSH
jgi:hypothetical protein